MPSDVQIAFFLQQLINAAPVAALYGTLAFGYSLSFGLVKRADFTPGAIFAFAGQVFVFFTAIGWNALTLVYPAALATGAIAALLYALAAQRIVVRYVTGPLALSSPNAVIAVSLAVMIVLMELMRLAADSRDLWLSPFLNTRHILWPLRAFPLVVTDIQVVNAILMASIVGGSALYLRRSAAGRQWRAVADDPLAAELLGISANRVIVRSSLATATFMVLGGVLSTSYYGSMDFGSGLMFSLKIILIAAVGEQTAPQRSALGAALFGIAETFWAAYVSYIWRDLVMIGVLVLLAVLLRREPTGV